MEHTKILHIKCPSCLKQLHAGTSWNKSISRYLCPGHSDVRINNFTQECDHYYFNLNQTILIGEFPTNETILYFDSDPDPYGEPFKLKWIAIDLNRLPEEIPQLINRIKKMKAFS